MIRCASLEFTKLLAWGDKDVVLLDPIPILYATGPTLAGRWVVEKTCILARLSATHSLFPILDRKVDLDHVGPLPLPSLRESLLRKDPSYA